MLNKKPLFQRSNERTAVGLLLVALLSLTAVGCVPDAPVKKRARLIVTLDAQPLEDARVTLVPIPLWNERGDSIPLAFGKTDSQGRCDLKSANNTEMLDAVRYQVIVTKPNANRLNYISAASDVLSPEAKLLFLDRANEVPDIFHRLSQVEVDLSKEEGATATIRLDLKK